MSSLAEVRPDFYAEIQSGGSGVTTSPAGWWPWMYSQIRATVTEKDLSIPADVLRVEKEIDAFRELEEDRDAEGSLPVPEETISRAKQLLRRIARGAKEAGIPWSNPAVAPGGNGEIDLSWEVYGRWSVLIVHPDQQNEVECVTKEVGSTPRRQILSSKDAVKRALWALENA